MPVRSAQSETAARRVICAGSVVEALLQRDAQLVRHDPDHVLDADLVAADDHVVVLAVADPLAALRQHHEILVAHGGVDLAEDPSYICRCSSLCAGYFGHPAVADRAARRRVLREDVDHPTPTGLLARMRLG